VQAQAEACGYKNNPYDGNSVSGYPARKLHNPAAPWLILRVEVAAKRALIDYTSQAANAKRVRVILG